MSSLLEYQLWIAYPDKLAYVRSDDLPHYANAKGWWRTEWRGDILDVHQRGGTPAPHLKPPPVELDSED